MCNPKLSVQGTCDLFVKNWLLLWAFLQACFFQYLFNFSCLHWKDQFPSSKHFCIHNPLPSACSLFDIVGHLLELMRNGPQPLGRE